MNKCKVLWISTCTPVNGMKHAGGVNFKHDFDDIASDERFDVTIISISEDADKAIVEEELSWVKHHLIYLEHSFISKIKKIKNIESKYNIWNVHAGLISNYCSDSIVRTCQQMSEHYIPDLIILEYTGCVVLVKELKKIFPHAVYAAKEHDVTYIGYERKKDYYNGLGGIIWGARYRHEKRVELQALKECDLIMPHNPDNFRTLIRDGISDNSLYWYVPYYQNLSHCKRNSNHRDILFYGAMARPENYLSCKWFIEKVMPLICDLDVRFVVLGSNPPTELKQMGNDRVIITGFVEHIEPYFEQSMCLVAPLVLGAGIKIKILEALSSGIIVLTNEVGIEGISATPGCEYIHCDEPRDYAEAIRRIKQNNIDEGAIRSATLKLIEKYNVEESFKKYKNKLLSRCGFKSEFGTE